MNKVRIDLPVLLPEVPDAHDACVRRLQALLSRERGIHDTHIVDDAGLSRLCLHYDTDTVTLDEVQRLARAAGAEVTARYGHGVWPLRAIAAEDAGRRLEAALAARSRSDRRLGQRAGPGGARRVRARQVPVHPSR